MTQSSELCKELSIAARDLRLLKSDRKQMMESVTGFSADAIADYTERAAAHIESLQAERDDFRIATEQAEEWIRDCSTWLLENDLDMQIPDGVLDTDPLDIADQLAALRATPQEEEGRCPSCGEYDRLKGGLCVSECATPQSAPQQEETR
jgi:hypothetical protein